MKKQLKKLNLNRETLHALEAPALLHLAGGAATDFCVTNKCNNSQYLQCNSDTTCGTYAC